MTRRPALLALVGLVLSGVFAVAVPRAEAQLFPGSGPAPQPDQPAVGGGTPEFRALWVDAYHEGFKTPQEVDRLIADARRANMNALVVQVRRRGDAYYAKSIEPRTEDSSIAPDFDALAHLIERAKTGGPRLEVHAWVATFPIWGDQNKPPRDPSHAFNLHGPAATGREDWLTRREDGETWAGAYFLDPGHPDAARHTVDVALQIVREYDVDGIHLDYVRYPEVGQHGGWGYNETSIARFNARHGREGRPAAGDPLWAQWRRDQVTAVVRRVYLGATGLKPRVKVSAAVIPWGDGPKTRADWERMSAYRAVFQDWRGWLEEGILDIVMPMNYFREGQPPQGIWFDNWVAFQRGHAYGRQVVPGVALYMNDPAQNLAQVKRALRPAADGSRVAGVVFYSYAANRREADRPDPEVWAALAEAGTTNDGLPPFAAPAPIPPMAWKAQPTTGSVLVRLPGLDGARVELAGPTRIGGEADGNGAFGAATAPPGAYTLTVRHPVLPEPRAAALEVKAGTLTELELGNK
jgi:uncharacterized lipoprotein YddW (UPF0748 family)